MRIAVIPHVKPPLYRHIPPWKVATVVTIQACTMPAAIPERMPKRPEMGHKATENQNPTIID